MPSHTWDIGHEHYKSQEISQLLYAETAQVEEDHVVNSPESREVYDKVYGVAEEKGNEESCKSKCSEFFISPVVNLRIWSFFTSELIIKLPLQERHGYSYRRIKYYLMEL